MTYNIVFVFIITVLIAYLFGLIIINIIDNRLSKLSMNMNISKESFTNNNNDEDNDKDNYKYNNKSNIEISTKKVYDYNKGKVQKKYAFDEEYYNQMTKDSMIEGFSEQPTFKQWDIEKKKTQVCIKNHKHEKRGTNLSCTYGVTNYADPSDMSVVDLRIFSLNYPPNMTLQDYINWLHCYYDKEDELPYNHLKNLQKLKSGIELVAEDGVLPPPAYYYPPLNAKDYFEKMYNDVNEFNIAPPLNSQTASMLGYNCDEYSEFSQNFDVYGSTGTIRNCELAEKKNAKKLYNYVNPKDSNSLNIEKEYEIYHIKNVEV